MLDSLDSPSIGMIYADRLEIYPPQRWRSFLVNGNLVPATLDKQPRLRIRRRLGPGRMIDRKFTTFCKRQLIVSIFEIYSEAPHKALRVVLYDIVGARDVEYRISSLERATLFSKELPILPQGTAVALPGNAPACLASAHIQAHQPSLLHHPGTFFAPPGRPSHKPTSRRANLPCPSPLGSARTPADDLLRPLPGRPTRDDPPPRAGRERHVIQVPLCPSYLIPHVVSFGGKRCCLFSLNTYTFPAIFRPSQRRLSMPKCRRFRHRRQTRRTRARARMRRTCRSPSCRSPW